MDKPNMLDTAKETIPQYTSKKIRGGKKNYLLIY